MWYIPAMTTPLEQTPRPIIQETSATLAKRLEQIRKNWGDSVVAKVIQARVDRIMDPDMGAVSDAEGHPLY